MPKIGHIKVKAARNAYHVMEHIGDNSYKKIATLYKFADTLPYRNAKWMTHNGKLKYRDFEEPQPKVKPLPKLPTPKKVVQTMDTTLRAKDKALERISKPEKLVIKEQSRPQKVRVQVDSKTSILVYPDEVENAITRYNQRYKQSQEQANTKQRQSPNKAKVKQPQSDLIFFH